MKLSDDDEKELEAVIEILDGLITIPVLAIMCRQAGTVRTPIAIHADVTSGRLRTGRLGGHFHATTRAEADRYIESLKARKRGEWGAIRPSQAALRFVERMDREAEQAAI